MPVRQIEHVALITLPDTSPQRREPTRPLEHRGTDFEARFDFNTLFYDTILAVDRSEVRIVAPSLFNLRGEIEHARFRAGPSGKVCKHRLRAMDRHDQVVVQLPADTETLTLECGLGTFPVHLNEAQPELFAGERVVFTLSKNNRIEWIQDWARFYRNVHGATAILIYDNASTEYSAADLLKALDAVSGLRKIVVVSWPFRHGPTGHGMRRYWDSNFSQLGVLEDARWRFLTDAKSVVNCDIDELVLTMTGETVFEQVERTRSGVVSFYGDWVFGLDGLTPPPDAALRFRDFRYVLRAVREWAYGLVPTFPMRCKPKWAVVPRKCPPSAQWHVHTINGWWPARIVSRTLRFRHFREISISWKYDRTARQTYDPARHFEDPIMLSAFARVNWEA